MANKKTKGTAVANAVIAISLLFLPWLSSASAGGEDATAATKNAGVEGSAANSSLLKLLTPEEAERLICTDKESRTFDRVYRISMCRRVIKDGVSVCEDYIVERTLSIQVQGAILDLNSLEQMPVEIARVLARHNGILDLNGLKNLSAEAAIALNGQEGSLTLDGLETISHETADALNRHTGPVSLSGLTRVSAAAYETLRTKRNAHLPNTLTLDQVTDGVIVWKLEHPGSFKQFATQLANQSERNLVVDRALLDEYGLSEERVLSQPPLAVMSLGQAGNWLAEQLSKQCPVKIVAGWTKDSVRFFEMPKKNR